MDTEKCKQLLDYFAKNQVKSLGVFGGEPTIHPDFVEIWNYAYLLFDNIALQAYQSGLTHRLGISWTPSVTSLNRKAV